MEIINVLSQLMSANDENDYRMFKSIKAGKYEMSVQGSTGHYCSPRRTLHPIGYNSMELALFINNKWLHITKSSVIRNFPRYRELLDRADGVNSAAPVFGYVPVGLLNDLYLYLKNHKPCK